MVKTVLNDVKNGRSYQKELDLSAFTGKKIGSKLNGDSIGAKGYEFEITGGSDNAGFPLSKSFESAIRKKILIKSKKGNTRKNVRGNQFGPYMAQVNMKVVKYGSEELPKLLGIEVKAKEEKPKEEKKAEVKIEKKAEEKLIKEEKK